MSNQTRATFYHRLIESFKHAYSKRTEMGDEEFLEKSKLERVYKCAKMICKLKLDHLKCFIFFYL